MSNVITEHRPLVIADLPKNRRETIRITLKVFKGHPFVDVRIFYDSDGELKPSSKGIGIRPDLPGRIIEALQKAEPAARTNGLLKIGESL